jgi:3-(3-hydroxy-phenyl)propionate hydroxylase
LSNKWLRAQPDGFIVASATINQPGQAHRDNASFFGFPRLAAPRAGADCRRRPGGHDAGGLLARHGIASLVVEADAGYCAGSRAICMSRRSQEIFGWVGADKALVDKGLSWVGGRSYFRDREVLHFQMPSEPTQRFAPMVNIQQFYAEEFAHKAALAQGGLADVRWSSKVTAVRPAADGAQVDIEAPDGTHTVQADWVVACDGGRSTVREQLGLQLEGTQYEGRT